MKKNIKKIIKKLKKNKKKIKKNSTKNRLVPNVPICQDWRYQEEDTDLHMVDITDLIMLLVVASDLEEPRSIHICKLYPKEFYGYKKKKKEVFSCLFI